MHIASRNRKELKPKVEQKKRHLWTNEAFIGLHRRKKQAYIPQLIAAPLRVYTLQTER